MGIDLRLPNITGTTEREQLSQIKSYLYQLTGQLQWALNAVESASAPSPVVQPSQNVIKQAKEEDAETTFAALKPLIIKSAEIVEAYYEEINSRFEGSYVAISDFGTYTEETDLKITANSNGIEQFYTNLQSIVTDIETLNFTLAESNAHIRSGVLYHDSNGIPVYGLEIGQRNTVDGEEVFNKYARFVSDRLSFYDRNNTEVAYISDRKLFICNVEITFSYKIGGLLDTVLSNGDVVTKWVGIGGEE